ncbi:hypothetical protein DICPUDRAFT_151769 [Dictyostelium purpureum]|uniref:Uncharacterized protein n=1 Tax=Dictyostelium purpureum TaxID=5786 RepID=F0ZJP7_DICPU|nr:uncharacterized protein DICPUDRAFT_151769 [Dictyostelium purpureum]EGC35852.1 hypothetical protein DICPUDRAFT_151769 [Dictyostelium purpureum]|eukprot:XP_003287641.1 hypothetical protein DICPUDRAFT_151769 [Dictyostelium purpureum]
MFFEIVLSQFISLSNSNGLFFIGLLPVDVDAAAELFLDTGFQNFLVFDNGDGADGDGDGDARLDSDLLNG